MILYIFPVSFYETLIQTLYRHLQHQFLELLFQSLLSYLKLYIMKIFKPTQSEFYNHLWTHCLASTIIHIWTILFFSLSLPIPLP